MNNLMIGRFGFVLLLALQMFLPFSYGDAFGQGRSRRQRAERTEDPMNRNTDAWRGLDKYLNSRNTRTGQVTGDEYHPELDTRSEVLLRRTVEVKYMDGYTEPFDAGKRVRSDALTRARLYAAAARNKEGTPIPEKKSLLSEGDFNRIEGVLGAAKQLADGPDDLIKRKAVQGAIDYAEYFLAIAEGRNAGNEQAAATVDGEMRDYVYRETFGRDLESLIQRAANNDPDLAVTFRGNLRSACGG